MTAMARTRDANDATWYVLRYAADFTPLADPALQRWSPWLEPTLFHDADRHVLELRPVPPAVDAEPLPGIALGLDGRVYAVDAATGRVLVRCGATQRELVCERGTVASAAGLALDRRGLLYVADPAARRILVVHTTDGSLAGVLAGGLDEPVDVAVSPDGRIYVADRDGGRIVVFNQRFTRCGHFVPVDSEGLITTPRPIAVTIDATGAVVVADAGYPRLLRYADGQLLGDVEARTMAVDANAPDDAHRLAALHLGIRLRQLALGRAFHPCGTYASAPLDGGAPGVQWHKIELEADLPPGTWLKVQSATSDDPADLADPDAIPFAGADDDLLELPSPAWAPYEDQDCTVKPRMAAAVPDRLIFSRPGRWLRLRLTLGSDGTATPSVRAVRLFHPRVSYLDMLPRVYRRDPGSADFLERFLALFEHVLTRVEDRYERFTRHLDPAAASIDVLDWLACLIDLAFDPSWPLARRRALVEAAMDLYATRGTPHGLARYVEIYTGRAPVIVEGFLERPQRPAFLGQLGTILGATTHLAPGRRRRTPEALLLARWAHRFTVLVFLDDECDRETTLPVVERIVSANKPAHTQHTLRAITAGDARVGAARVGVDALLGARATPRVRLGGCGPGGNENGSVLGTDAVLGGSVGGSDAASALWI